MSDWTRVRGPIGPLSSLVPIRWHPDRLGSPDDRQFGELINRAFPRFT